MMWGNVFFRRFPILPCTARTLRSRSKAPDCRKVEQHLKDAASYDEAIGEEQSPWASSSYHDDNASIERRRTAIAGNDPGQVLGRDPPAGVLDDSRNTVLVFPGQGSQFVGMASEVIHLQPVKDLYQRAGQILGYDLLHMSLEGPAESLNKTRYCQPAVVVASLAAVEALYHKDRSLVQNCVRVAGFSVGEITALIFSGVLSLADGLTLIKTRAEAMEFASELIPSGMMTIFFGADNKVGLACEAARKWCVNNHGIDDPVCQVANYLHSGGKVIAGHVEALGFIEANKEDFNIRKTKRLPVSGAFHTPLMLPAVDPFREALAGTRLRQPRIPVFSNVTGNPYDGANEVSKLLPKQIVKAVKWEQTVKSMYECHRHASIDDRSFYPTTIECGPGKSLTAMLRKLNGKAANKSLTVAV